jgi:hypothetical protein
VLVHTLLGDASLPRLVDEPPGIVVQAGPEVRPQPGQRLSLVAERRHVYLFDAASGAALMPRRTASAAGRRP